MAIGLRLPYDSNHALFGFSPAIPHNGDLTQSIMKTTIILNPVEKEALLFALVTAANRPTFATVESVRPLKMRAAFRTAPLYKRTVLQVLVGVEYSRTKAAKEIIANGGEIGPAPLGRERIAGPDGILKGVYRSVRSGGLQMGAKPIKTMKSEIIDGSGNPVDRATVLETAVKKELEKRDSAPNWLTLPFRNMERLAMLGCIAK